MLYKVKTKKLEDCVHSCFNDDVWECGGIIKKKDIKLAIAKKDFIDSYATDSDKNSFWSLEDHIKRIAYLVVHPSNEPLELDFSLEGAYLLDGNHRFAAAIYRNEPFVIVEVSGFIDDFAEWYEAEEIE